MVQRGHRRIGFLTLPANHVARRLRLRGYRRALKSSGIAFDPSLVVTGALVDPAEEYDGLPAALDRLLALPAPPTAICCANDKMAMRVYALLNGRGKRIPEDISVVGYDDYRIITEHLHPTLTSVELPYRAIGARAAERMVQLLSGPEEPNETVVDLISGPVAWRQSATFCDPSVTAFKSKRRKHP